VVTWSSGGEGKSSDVEEGHCILPPLLFTSWLGLVKVKFIKFGQIFRKLYQYLECKIYGIGIVPILYIFDIMGTDICFYILNFI
jgi:hypothetical protein